MGFGEGVRAGKGSPGGLDSSRVFPKGKHARRQAEVMPGQMIPEERSDEDSILPGMSESAPERVVKTPTPANGIRNDVIENEVRALARSS